MGRDGRCHVAGALRNYLTLVAVSFDSPLLLLESSRMRRNSSCLSAWRPFSGVVLASRCLHAATMRTGGLGGRDEAHQGSSATPFLHSKTQRMIDGVSGPNASYTPPLDRALYHSSPSRCAVAAAPWLAVDDGVVLPQCAPKCSRSPAGPVGPVGPVLRCRPRSDRQPVAPRLPLACPD